MITILMALAVIAVALDNPRTRRWFVKSEPPRLLPQSSQSLEDWKQVFRETVVSVDGALSPEMEAFLSGSTSPEASDSPSRLKSLKGDDLDQFVAEFNAHIYDSDRVATVRRWHKKGFRFPAKLRIKLIEVMVYGDNRKKIVDMFDEQDQ